MKFQIRPPEWRNQGVEPQDKLKADGFQAGYKPPASYFNWFFNRVFECLTELQKKSAELDNKKLIVVMENDIPVPDRKPNTFYFRVTDQQTAASTDNIKVSPNMGLKLL